MDSSHFLKHKSEIKTTQILQVGVEMFITGFNPMESRIEAY